jgi:hypothetical protein
VLTAVSSNVTGATRVTGKLTYEEENQIKITMGKKNKPLLIEVSWCFLRRFTKMPAMKLKVVHTCYNAQRSESEFKIILFSQVGYSTIQALEPMLNMQEAEYSTTKVSR